MKVNQSISVVRIIALIMVMLGLTLATANWIMFIGSVNLQESIALGSYFDALNDYKKANRFILLGYLSVSLWGLLLGALSKSVGTSIATEK